MSSGKIINLCSHDISIKDIHGKIRIFKPSGTECRVNPHPKDVEYHDGIAMYTEVYGDIENLPEIKDGVIYIVSARVTNALNGARPDILSPGRQEKSKIGKVMFSMGLRRKF